MEYDDDFQIKSYRTKSKKFAKDAVNYSLDEVAEKKRINNNFPRRNWVRESFFVF